MVIDIGGGTTDVMVCEYSRDPDAHIVVLSPDPLFWEGFNLAGDDIVKSIVERVVLPPIAEYAREQGCTSTFECMNFLFGPHLGTQNGTIAVDVLHAGGLSDSLGYFGSRAGKQECLFLYLQ